MQKLALLLALAAFPAQAWALNTTELLSTIAMPLAVAAVSNVSGVPQSQLSNLVATLNQANVPPVRFVEVIRYVPVALIDQNGQPFVAYVQRETSQGVTGDALANAIVDRLRTNYNVTPTLRLTGEPTEVVVREDYIPSVASTRFESDPFSVIALPLAVAAISDVNGVSRDELANLIATLNNANVPPVQEIEIIRYAPVALVADNGQPFVQFVQQQTAQGVTGPALVPVIVQQLRTYYPPQTQIALNTTAPRRVVVERDFFPPVVVNRVEEVRVHPHGGPPGQIKKQLGLQTGAEVVHGTKPGRQFTPAPVAVAPRKERGHGHGHAQGKREHGAPPPAPMISSAPPAAAPPVMPPGLAKGHHEGGPPAGGPPGQAKPKGGKGKGKD